MPRVSWCFVALGSLGAGLATLVSSDAGRSFAFDALGLIAAAGAVYGVLRNRPDRRVAWLLLAIGLVLFAAGDVAYDVATAVPAPARATRGPTSSTWPRTRASRSRCTCSRADTSDATPRSTARSSRSRRRR